MIRRSQTAATAEELAMKKYNTDDPKLTAYALGELDEADRAAVEAQLAEDEASRKFVQEVRETVAELSDVLDTEARCAKELKNFQVNERPSEVGYSRFRFGGWLEEYFSPLYLGYEINSQSPSRHLAIGELRDVGSGIVRATASFLTDAKSQSLRQNIANDASKRLDAWTQWAEAFRDENALVSEERWRKELAEVKRERPR
jgi:hypothetical protein